MLKLQESTNLKLSKLASKKELPNNQICGFCRTKKLTRQWYSKELAIFICGDCCTKFRGISSMGVNIPFIKCPIDMADDSVSLADYKLAEKFGNESFFNMLKNKQGVKLEGEMVLPTFGKINYIIKKSPKAGENVGVVQINVNNDNNAVLLGEKSFKFTVPIGEPDFTPEIEKCVYYATKKLREEKLNNGASKNESDSVDASICLNDTPIPAEDETYLNGVNKSRILDLIGKYDENKNNTQCSDDIWGYARRINLIRSAYIDAEKKTDEMKMYITKEALNSSIGITIIMLSFTILMIYCAKNFKKPEGFITLAVSISAFILSRTIRHNQDKIEMEIEKMWNMALDTKK